MSKVEIERGIDWPKYAREMHNYLGKSYISTSVEGSYMEIERRAPVSQTSLEILGHEGVRTRGLWRIEGDFMGGPFDNYSWYSNIDSTYYMIDFYVHAPKEGKKTFMRHLEYVFGTIEQVK
jgi:hypothetical protein